MLGLPVSVTATPPPPLQIKIVPASLQGKDSLPIIVPNTANVSAAACVSAQSAAVVSLQVVNSADTPGNTDEDEVTEVLPAEEVNIILNSWLKLVLYEAWSLFIHKHLGLLMV